MDKSELPDDLPKDLVSIAVFNGTDSVARDIVERELSSASIVHFVEGSIVFNVLVSANDADRAREILRDSKELKTRWHQLIVEENKTDEHKSETD